MKKYVPKERPIGIESNIEDELESNKPSLEWVEHENSIGKHKAESEMISEDVVEPEREEDEIIKLNEDQCKRYLQKEFKYKQKQYRTFHLQYHPKLLCKAIWAYEEKDGQPILDQTILMRLRTFRNK